MNFNTYSTKLGLKPHCSQTQPADSWCTCMRKLLCKWELRALAFTLLQNDNCTNGACSSASVQICRHMIAHGPNKLDASKLIKALALSHTRTHTHPDILPSIFWIVLAVWRNEIYKDIELETEADTCSFWQSCNDSFCKHFFCICKMSISCSMCSSQVAILSQWSYRRPFHGITGQQAMAAVSSAKSLTVLVMYRLWSQWIVNSGSLMELIYQECNSSIDHQFVGEWIAMMQHMRQICGQDIHASWPWCIRSVRRPLRPANETAAAGTVYHQQDTKTGQHLHF